MKSILPKWVHSLSPFKHKASEPVLAYDHIFVHPCVIGKQPHIVYPRGLKGSSPELYRKLKRYFKHQGYALKEDQRSAKNNRSIFGDRRILVPTLLFTASMLFESSAFADFETNLNDSPSNQNQQIELRIVPNNAIRDQIKKQIGDFRNTKDKPVINIKAPITSEITQRIHDQLQSHYIKQASDPEYILDDLRKVAIYYSEFPEVISLLNALANKNWQLVYSEDDWVTTASGNAFEVKKAVIHFNTRSAAQLRLNNGCKENPICIASPADAMLHELLHTHSMLVKTDEFIVQGGMSSVMYPYKHEYSVIKSERTLYARMSLQDAIKRPSRYEHTGRTVKAHCPTCIK